MKLWPSWVSIVEMVSSTEMRWPSRCSASISTARPIIVASPVATYRARPAACAARSRSGTIVSARVRPSASSRVQPSSVCAAVFQSVMTPRSSQETNAWLAASTMRRARAWLSRSARSARLPSVMSIETPIMRTGLPSSPRMSWPPVAIVRTDPSGRTTRCSIVNGSPVS